MKLESLQLSTLHAKDDAKVRLPAYIGYTVIVPDSYVLFCVVD
jgi:hypothetical protein